MKLRSQAAFTLIELLVVITIIGILAGIALPAMQNAQVSARQTAVLSNVKQIVTSLRLYAQDNDGKFPTYANPGGVAGNAAITSSNQAFRQLFSTYLTNEKIFYCPNSAWTPTQPDNVYNTNGASDAADTLRTGENHFAYYPGMNDGSNANWPLVCDGFVTGGMSDPAYIATKSTRGGVWGGKIALVGHPDASVEKLKLNSSYKADRKVTAGGAAVNFFAKAASAGDTEWFTTDPVNPD